jgi:hypothetical protein
MTTCEKIGYDNVVVPLQEPPAVFVSAILKFPEATAQIPPVILENSGARFVVNVDGIFPSLVDLGCSFGFYPSFKRVNSSMLAKGLFGIDRVVSQRLWLCAYSLQDHLIYVVRPFCLLALCSSPDLSIESHHELRLKWIASIAPYLVSHR